MSQELLTVLETQVFLFERVKANTDILLLEPDTVSRRRLLNAVEYVSEAIGHFIDLNKNQINALKGVSANDEEKGRAPGA